MTRPRVLLVEDHPLVQEAIRNLVSFHCEVVGLLNAAEDLPQFLDKLKPDVLVLDVSLPGKSGLQVLPDVRTRFRSLCVVIASEHEEPAYIRAAFERGADAYVVKSQLYDELLPSIQEALSKRARVRLVSSS